MQDIRPVMLSLAMVLLLAGLSLAQGDEAFVTQDVDFTKSSPVYAKVKGNISNNSGTDLTQADFDILVYDKAGKLINQAPFTVRNFVAGSTREFHTTIQANVQHISSHKVKFRQREVGAVQTTGDFITQKVDFIKISRAYAKAKGELTNNSAKNLRQADFVILTYDAGGKLINSAFFSIRNFMAGTTRSFQTTIQANVKHISTYKIELKQAKEIPPVPTAY